MSDSVLQRLATRRVESLAEPASAVVSDAPDDLGAFGHLRGIRDRAVMLELRKRNGNIMAIGYGYIECVEFDPTEGITITALGRKIQIKGRNLNAEVRPGVRLYECTTRHRVPWIRESNAFDCRATTNSDILIDTIVW